MKIEKPPNIFLAVYAPTVEENEEIEFGDVPFLVVDRYSTPLNIK